MLIFEGVLFHLCGFFAHVVAWLLFQAGFCRIVRWKASRNFNSPPATLYTLNEQGSWNYPFPKTLSNANVWYFCGNSFFKFVPCLGPSVLFQWPLMKLNLLHCLAVVPRISTCCTSRVYLLMAYPWWNSEESRRLFWTRTRHKGHKRHVSFNRFNIFGFWKTYLFRPLPIWKSTSHVRKREKYDFQFIGSILIDFCIFTYTFIYLCKRSSIRM